MGLNDDFIQDHDLDWFAGFSNEYLAHFTSGGTAAIPKKIKESIEFYNIVYDYFFFFLHKCDIQIIESNLPSFTNQFKRENYLSSYIDLASKGLFSYNINYIDNSYLLVAKPEKPLLLNKLPQYIRDLLFQLSSEVESGAKIIATIEYETSNADPIKRQ